MAVVTLYRKNALSIGMWSIWAEGNVIHISHSSTIDGAKINHSEVVQSGKQSRTLAQQVQHRIDSRISKQRDKGYTDSIEEASTQLLNQLGLAVPMLAQTFDEKKHDISSGVHIQRKLNGLRCLATKVNGKIIMYSRRGKLFEHLHEIAESLEKILPEGETFDGELYVHGTSLQTIQSWAKRRQQNTLHLSYYVYDYMDDADYPTRLSFIQSCFNYAAEQSLEHPRVAILPTKLVSSLGELMASMRKARDAKFEGIMVRFPGYPYEDGKRSKSLLKLKDVMTDEAICIDITLSEKGNPVLTLDWNGKRFGASPPGGDLERLEAYKHQDKFVGQRVTIEYREMTDDGVPFHAVAVAWRMD